MDNSAFIAANILKQLGGNRFLIMTGVKPLHRHENSVAFKLPRNKSKATHLKITLEASDTYKMEFIRCGKELTTMQEFKNVYCDQLEEFFYSATGILTRL